MTAAVRSRHRHSDHRQALDVWGTRVVLIFLLLFVIYLTFDRAQELDPAEEDSTWKERQNFQKDNVLYNAFCNKTNELLYVRETETTTQLVAFDLTTNSAKVTNEDENIKFRKHPSFTSVTQSDSSSSCSIFSLGGYSVNGTIEKSADIVNTTASAGVDLTVRVSEQNVTLFKNITRIFDSSTAVSVGDQVFLFGGMQDENIVIGFNTSTSEFYEIEVSGTGFQQVQSRCKQSAGEYDGKIYIYGGYDCGNPANLHVSLHSFDPSTSEFASVLSDADFDKEASKLGRVDQPAREVFGRHSASLVINDGRIFIHGGADGSFQYFDKMFITNLSQNDDGEETIKCEKDGEKFAFCIYYAGDSDSAKKQLASSRTQFSTAFISNGTFYVQTTAAAHYFKEFQGTALLSIPISTITRDMFAYSSTMWGFYLLQLIMIGAILVFMMVVLLFVFRRPLRQDVFSPTATRHAPWFHGALFGAPPVAPGVDQSVMDQLPKLSYAEIENIRSNQKQQPVDIEMSSIITESTQPENTIGNTPIGFDEGKLAFRHEMGCCCICLSDFAQNDVLTSLPCCHLFHPDCIGSWLKKNKLCPLCKAAVTQDAVMKFKSKLHQMKTESLAVANS